jgi:Ran GTPase-activating protein (RanGAP) involved in mRNA processing and transport
MRILNRSRQNINSSEQIGALNAELQRDPQITSLNLGYNRIKNPAAISALGTLLQQNLQITSLDLSCNNIESAEAIEAETIEALVKALKGTNVTSLNLLGNKIKSPEAIEALGRALKGTNVTSLDLSGNKIKSPEAIAALRELLRQNPKITSLGFGGNYIESADAIEALGRALKGTNVTSLDLSGNKIQSPEAIAALCALLRQNQQITSLNLGYNDIEDSNLGALLQQNRQITSLNLSGNRIDSPERIAALRELLRQNQQITSLDLSNNRIDSPERIAALRELLRQNPQIRSLDLSHTGLTGYAGDELLSLVMKFRHLHHVGNLDYQRLPSGATNFIHVSYKAQIEEQLRFNRDLSVKAGIALLVKRTDPQVHIDVVVHTLSFLEQAQGLSSQGIEDFITEATSPAFNFQRGNPNAISFDAAAGRIPKISITFESRDGLRAFLANNGNTFRELEKIGAIVEDSGRGVEIIAPNTSGGILRDRMVAIRKELTPLWRRLEDSRSDAARLAIAAHEPVMELSGFDENKDAPEARPVGRLEGFGADAEMATIRRRLDNQKVESVKSRTESNRSTSQVAGAGRYEERDLPGLDEGNDEKAAADPGRTITNAQAAAPVPEVGQHTQSVVAARSAAGSVCCTIC